MCFSSCGYSDKHFPKQLFFPLRRKEFEALKNGQLIRKHFHNIASMPRLDVIVWNKEKSIDKKAYEPIRRQGVSFANVPCGASDIAVIERGDCVTAHYGSFDVTVVLESVLKKTRREAK